MEKVAHTVTVTAHLLAYETRENSRVRRRLGGRGWNALGRVGARTTFQKDYVLLLAFKFPTLVQVSDHGQKTLFS